MDPVLIAVVGIFVLAATVAGGATSWWFTRNAPEQRRLRSLSTAGLTLAPAQTRTLGIEQLDPFLQRLSRLAAQSPQRANQTQRRLMQAGYTGQAAGIYLRLAQLGLPIVLFALTFAMVGPSYWMFALLAAAAGYIIPVFYLRRRIRQRQKAIENGLADALDLITVCVEAGSGIDQALSKAAEELELSHRALAGEFRMITTEIRAGKSRLDAFRMFSERTGVDDVRSLVAMLTQTDRFGTSVGQALRGHADTIRTKRRQRAEERAAKVSVKMVFPLVLCLFPALYVICFGSVVVRVYHAFF
jgi:tight adherence protein C